MCARNGKVGTVIILGFEIGKMRTKLRKWTKTLATDNACSVCDGFP